MSGSHNRRNFLVSGGGIAGLTAALCLARGGFHVDVFERAEGFETIGAGIQLSPNALNVLDELGLARQVKEVSVAPSAIRIMNAMSGRDISRIPLGGTAIARYGFPYLAIHRADLHQVLARAVHGNPDIDLQLNARFEDLAVHANGVTGLVFQSGQMTEYSGSGMIVADGVWSKLRETHFGLKPASYSGLVAWRGLIAADQLPGSQDMENIQLWLAPHAHAVTYPVRGGRYLNVVFITAAKADDENRIDEPNWAGAGSTSELDRHTRRWHREFRSLLAYRTRWTRWPLYRAPAGSWVKGPTTLIGDAAHAMLPLAAQGAVMGIEDATILGRCLAQAEDGVAGAESAMRRFEKLRMGRISRAQRLTLVNRFIYHLPQPAATARNLVMALMGGERLLSRQDWLYRWQPD